MLLMTSKTIDYKKLSSESKAKIEVGRFKGLGRNDSKTTQRDNYGS